MNDGNNPFGSSRPGVVCTDPDCPCNRPVAVRGRVVYDARPATAPRRGSAS